MVNCRSDLNVGFDGIISISTSCSTETAATCGGEPLEGPSTHSVNISGYAMNSLWLGESGKAGVNIPFIRKYDCASGKVYLIFAGAGQAYVSGSISSLATLVKSFSSSTFISANASSLVYTKGTQTSGYGLDYSGGPISFNSRNVVSINIMGGEHFLQNFSVEAQCGQLPIATYSFIAPMEGT